MVPSVASLLLAASLIQVPFSSSLEVRLPGTARLPARGDVVGDFLVVASRSNSEGARVTTLRPLALGELDVPLPGAQPSRIEVISTLGPDARPQPPLIPAAPPFPWSIAAAPLAAAALIVIATLLLNRRRGRDPLQQLERSLRPLSFAKAWAAEDAPDRLARDCRGFLEAVTAAPCAAMTTRELSRLLAARCDPGLATPFAIALVLADEARFAGTAPPAAAAVEVVRNVLGAAPEVALAIGGRR